MKNKRTVIAIISCIVLVITFTMLISYAYWRVSKTQTGTNTINGACLSIRLEQYYDENENLIEGFTLNDAWPITDQEGLEQDGYSFKVVNDCSEKVNYQVSLDSLEVSGQRMNPEFIKVSIDNGEVHRYGLLEDSFEAEYPTIAHKKVYTGTIDGYGEVEHTIKLWISSDSPNEEIGKEFASKVRVETGQGIQSNQVVANGLRILSDPNEPNVTLDNISVGDLVGYQTEQFYVIGIDGNNIKLLSRYILNVGDYVNPNGTVGLQYPELGMTRTNVDDPDSAVEYGENLRCEYDENDECIEGSEYYEHPYGSLAFSASNYWYDENNNTYVSPYTSSSFVYSDQSNLKQYVDAYVEELVSMGLNATNGTILSIEDVAKICHLKQITNEGDYNDECPSYLFETYYWLGTNSAYNRIWQVVGGYLVKEVHGFSEDFGVRPVITISLD